jgi:metallophosphoesterase (TIGR00282 family)
LRFVLSQVPEAGPGAPSRDLGTRDVGTTLNILFVGDIFGSAGRRIVREHIGHVREAHKVDLTIVNVENAAGGFGVTPGLAEEIFELGADVLTTGNHVWDKKELMDYLNSAAPYTHDHARRVLRPANFPPGVPGYGFYEGKTAGGVDYAVLQLQGRVFMTAIDDPFRTADSLLASVRAKVIVVDFHAEATSEKAAMGWYLDGRVTAVLGTHTHVPTADERILPHGTAYQTDVGMSGPYDSIIGVEKELVLHKFLTAMPGKFEAAKGNPKMCGSVVTCDPATGKASAIQRVMLGE